MPTFCTTFSPCDANKQREVMRADAERPRHAKESDEEVSCLIVRILLGKWGGWDQPAGFLRGEPIDLQRRRRAHPRLIETRAMDQQARVFTLGGERFRVLAELLISAAARQR